MFVFRGCVFKNRFVRSHFQFALSILDNICQVNSQLQEQYMTVPFAWCLVKQLKRDFSDDMNKITSGVYCNWRFPEKMNRQQISSFKLILSELLLDMDIRFVCPSFSIDTRAAHRNIDETTRRLNESYVKNVQRQCPLFEQV